MNSTQQELRFNGADYDSERDNGRLGAQLKRVFDYVSDGSWHTLENMAVNTGDPAASISAQLRHLRKKRFGSWNVERRYINNGLYEYRLKGRS
jgi:uncharacterized protein (DUF2132 family)